MFDIIPAIDILNGEVVRLTQGDYDQVDHYDFTPVSLAEHYVKHGATKIHLVDLDGAKDGTLTNLDTFKAIREAVDCELELGGGIRSKESVQTYIDIGINYIVLGSLLVKDPELSFDIIRAYPDKIVAGLDTKHGELVIQGWLEKSPMTLDTILDKLKQLPVAYIVCTEVTKDGMMQGPDMPGLINLTQKTTIPVIASGGVSTLENIQELKTVSGISGCIVGKAILNNSIPIDKIW